MWNSSNGEIVLRGKRAALFQSGLESLVFYIDQSDEIGENYHVSVSVFDKLKRLEKLAILEQVASALLEEATPAPPLTAVSEGAVAAVYFQVLDNAQLEIDDSGAAGTRELILAAHREIDPEPEEIPDVTCDDMGEWRIEIEGCLDMILWDRDWEEEFIKPDDPPDVANEIREFARISDDYYSAVPPDPNPEQLKRIEENLRRLCDEKSFSGE